MRLNNAAIPNANGSNACGVRSPVTSLQNSVSLRLSNRYLVKLFTNMVGCSSIDESRACKTKPIKGLATKNIAASTNISLKYVLRFIYVPKRKSQQTKHHNVYA